MEIRWRPEARNGLMGALAAAAPGVGLALEAAMEGEREAMRLASAIPPGAGKMVREEVQRRERDLRMRPAMAYRSVADDLIQGRWLP